MLNLLHVGKWLSDGTSTRDGRNAYLDSRYVYQLVLKIEEAHKLLSS